MLVEAQKGGKCTKYDIRVSFVAKLTHFMAIYDQPKNKSAPKSVRQKVKLPIGIYWSVSISNVMCICNLVVRRN